MANDIPAKSQADAPIRVAIVGGGCAGLAAAWHLSKQKNFEIHVYEKSWRLGGKGASVRSTDGRVLDHGLHVWLGFYENAFRMIRECYQEVERRGFGPGAEAPSDRLPYARFSDAFFPESNIGVAHRDGDGKWTAWSALFPPEPGLPGEPMDEQSNPFTLANYLLRSFSLLKTLMLSIVEPPLEHVPGQPRPDQRSKSDEALNLHFTSVNGTTSLQLLIERTAQLLRSGSLTGAAVLSQAIQVLETWLENLDFAPQIADSAVQLALAVVTQTRKLLADAASVDSTIRTKTAVIDILLTISVGLLRDGVLFDKDGLDSINEFDYRAWLRQNGATPLSLESPFLTGIYDFLFAYKNGDKRTPALAAGVALRGALRMFFTYRGSIFWRMRSGMGDAVFAPLYKVLMEQRPIQLADGTETKASPVYFHLLHKLDSVSIQQRNGNRYIDSLTFRVADQPKGSPIQDPLDGILGCWPERKEPALVEELTLDRDNFDAAILAMGVDDLKGVLMAGGAEILPDRWARMFSDVKTAATQSAQVWLARDPETLGWHLGPRLITALDMQFDTWADMTHTLTSEGNYRIKAGVNSDLDNAQSVAYFCAALPQADVSQATDNKKETLEEQIADRLGRMLEREISQLWTGMDGPAVLSRHVQANFMGSDRYTLSLPNSIASRISPLDRTFENATIAGDWTACGLDVGCVEAAVMSGMLAAHAISGTPDLKSIIGYDHP